MNVLKKKSFNEIIDDNINIDIVKKINFEN
jgi:hypothetical protein